MIPSSRIHLSGGPHDGRTVRCASATPPDPFVMPELGDGLPEAVYRRASRILPGGGAIHWRYEFDPHGRNLHAS